MAGNDVILSGADVTANADATALLLQILDAKTQALAKSLGLVAGDDNDMITSSGSLAVTSCGKRCVCRSAYVRYRRPRW